MDVLFHIFFLLLMVSTLDLVDFQIFPDNPRITNDKGIGLWGEENKGMKV